MSMVYAGDYYVRTHIYIDEWALTQDGRPRPFYLQFNKLLVERFTQKVTKQRNVAQKQGNCTIVNNG